MPPTPKTMKRRNKRLLLGLIVVLLVASALIFLYVKFLKNTPPVANDDAVSTPEDTTLTFDPRGNDLDANKDSFFISNVTTTNGTVAVLHRTDVVYDPPTNFNGTISLVYTINDGKGGTNSAVITVTVTPVNDAPIANDQSVSTLEDTALPITLTGSDVEGNPLTYILVSGPANGALSGFNTNTGALTYTPATNYNGADSLVFRVADGTTNSAVATISITVTPVNDAPIANHQSVSTPEDTALPITLSGAEVEGNPLTYILVSGPTNGVIGGFNTNTGALTYSPNTNYNGSDSFIFSVKDGTTNSAVAAVSITVTPVNDVPIANDQAVSTLEDTALPITLTGSDLEGSPLTFMLVSGPTNGIVPGFNTNTGSLIYWPNTNYAGSDLFKFRTSDGANSSLLATVSITVTPVNDAPIVNTPEEPQTFIPVSGPTNSAMNRFLLSARIGFNISGKFSGLGNGLFSGGTPTPRFTPDGDPYNYDDGYLLTDSSGNAGGQTWYVGYDDSAAQISGNQLLLSRSTASANTPGADQDADVSVGVALTYQRQLGRFEEGFAWGVEAGVNFQPIKFTDNGSYAATVTKVTDAYEFTPGTTPPSATPGSPYQGSYGAPGFLFGDTIVGTSTQTIPGGAAFAGSHEFDGDLWGLQLGIYGADRLSEHWHVSMSGGLALAVLAADVTWSEQATLPGGGLASASGVGNDSEVLYGLYLGATVGYDLGKNWSVIGGMQYQYLSKYENDFSGRSVEIDFSGSLFVTLGISKSF